MPKAPLYLALALACLLPALSCGTDAKPIDSDQKSLKIYYFWNTSGDSNQHSSIMTGVEKARGNERIKRLLQTGTIQIIGVPDAENTEDAIAKAHELRRRPDTLAIIGHTYSGTTWSLLPAYAEAGIPVIVTNSTSPYLLHQHGEKDEPNIDFSKSSTSPSVPNFKNVFRLIASDIPDQASAIRLTIRELGKERKQSGPARVMLICDETSRYNTRVYSKPMCDYLAQPSAQEAPARGKIADYSIVSSRSVDLDHADLWGLITQIHAVEPEYIVLVGYGELDLDVIQGLVERASPKAPASHYKFIMTDAAFGSRRRFPADLDIYITSPARPHPDNPQCDSSDALEGEEPQTKAPATAATTKKRSGRKDPPAVPETTEAMAYDAVMILADSIENCRRDRGHLSRSCVLDDLRRRQGNLHGVCDRYYDLHDGEVQSAYYYVYSNSHPKNPEVSPSPKWCARSQDVELKLFGAACAQLANSETSNQRVVGGQYQ